MNRTHFDHVGDRHSGSRHHGGRHHGRGFRRGHLHVAVLQQIAKAPSHGYEIMRAIERNTGGRYAPSPGVLYPTLTHLEELGFIAADAEGARKSYRITEAGTEYLTAHSEPVEMPEPTSEAAAEVRANDSSVHDFPSADKRVRRALRNVHTALELRLDGVVLGDAQQEAIATALDCAAHAIERC